MIAYVMREDRFVIKSQRGFKGADAWGRRIWSEPTSRGHEASSELCQEKLNLQDAFARVKGVRSLVDPRLAALKQRAHGFVGVALGSNTTIRKYLTQKTLTDLVRDYCFERHTFCCSSPSGGMILYIFSTCF